MLYATLRPIPAWRRIPAANDPLPESGEPLITLSYIEGDQLAIAAHNRLKSSIVVR